MADRGDMERTGKRMMAMSKRSRPATSGNKNVQSRARRKGAGAQLMRGMQRPLKGPGV